jgi:hypothetical protein
VRAARATLHDVEMISLINSDHGDIDLDMAKYISDMLKSIWDMLVVNLWKDTLAANLALFEVKVVPDPFTSGTWRGFAFRHPHRSTQRWVELGNDAAADLCKIDAYGFSISWSW